MRNGNKTKPSTNRKSVAVRTRATDPTVIPPLTASGLKSALWETMIDLRHDQMTAGRADAIAAGAREILRTVRTQLQVANQAKRGVPREIVDFSEQ